MIVLGYSGFTRDSRRAAQGRSLGMTGLGFDRMVRSVDGELPISHFPLGFFGHDAAAGLVVDGEVVACAAEERFTRVKHGLNVAGNPLLGTTLLGAWQAYAQVLVPGSGVYVSSDVFWRVNWFPAHQTE